MPTPSALIHLDSPLGTLRATFEGPSLTNLDFVAAGPAAAPAGPPGPPEAADLRRHLDRYFQGERVVPSFSLSPRGTDFQQVVWGALCSIPWGQTRSYAEIAQAIGRPQAVRAVAQAVGRNPIAILVPCHRVIGSTCTLTGYAGGLVRKRALLELEGLLVAGAGARDRVRPAPRHAMLIGANA